MTCAGCAESIRVCAGLEFNPAHPENPRFMRGIRSLATHVCRVCRVEAQNTHSPLRMYFSVNGKTEFFHKDGGVFLPGTPGTPGTPGQKQANSRGKWGVPGWSATRHTFGHTLHKTSKMEVLGL